MVMTPVEFRQMPFVDLGAMLACLLLIPKDDK